MSALETQRHQFEIEVQSQLIESESDFVAGHYFFAYRIRIKNKGSTEGQLLSRHWIITDGNGNVENVRGAGVIGQQPKIAAGKFFEYESACPLNTPFGSMKGTYQMLSADGSSFEIEIPEFFLVAPNALH